jgi:hypothetical protein
VWPVSSATSITLPRALDEADIGALRGTWSSRLWFRGPWRQRLVLPVRDSSFPSVENLCQCCLVELSATRGTLQIHNGRVETDLCDFRFTKPWNSQGTSESRSEERSTATSTDWWRPQRAAARNTVAAEVPLRILSVERTGDVL